MLYEPPKIKRYILIGASAIILAVLIVAIVPFFFRDKKIQVPTANIPMTAKQSKIQKEQNKLIEMSKIQSNFAPSQEQIQKDSNRLIEEAKASGSGKSPEEIQKDQNSLIETTKK
jgi:hypothetical protein